MNEAVKEVIFVGLPGPTHHYSGLSPDNVASGLNRGSISNPKEAALQALDLMRLLRSLGVTAGVLPPQHRPHMPLLRQHFDGDNASIIRQAAHGAPALLEKSNSAAAMWTANAATVGAANDTGDGKLHLTPANLFTNLHRRIEAEDTYHVLKEIFKESRECIVHPPLSASLGERDEGAANHMRLAPSHQEPGLNIFVYGADGSKLDPESARQTLSASKALQAQFQLPDSRTLFLRQNPDVIRQGVFHNDVIAVSNENVVLAHRQAYDGEKDFDRIRQAYAALNSGLEPVILVIENTDLSVEEAVHSYFFNSQIVTKSDGKMALIAPIEVELLYEGKAKRFMEHICADSGNPIDEVHVVDLRQSMRNGGGPACLRLRVPMGVGQLSAIERDINVIADDALLDALEHMICQTYPEELVSGDLGNPALYHCSLKVMEQLSELMKINLRV